MTMQVFKYCWRSKDFLSKWQTHYSTVKVTGWASSAKCKIKCDLKREIQLLVSSRCSMCVHMHHTCREFSSGPFGFMFQTHERLPHNLSTRPATSSNIPTCWIHRGSSTQWGSTPTGMERHLCGAQTRWQEDYHLPWQPVGVEGCCRSSSSTAPPGVVVIHEHTPLQCRHHPTPLQFNAHHHC